MPSMAVIMMRLQVIAVIVNLEVQNVNQKENKVSESKKVLGQEK